jgi:hypothetical protein
LHGKGSDGDRVVAWPAQEHYRKGGVSDLARADRLKHFESVESPQAHVEKRSLYSSLAQDAHRTEPIPNLLNFHAIAFQPVAKHASGDGIRFREQHSRSLVERLRRAGFAGTAKG